VLERKAESAGERRPEEVVEDTTPPPEIAVRVSAAAGRWTAVT